MLKPKLLLRNAMSVSVGRVTLTNDRPLWVVVGMFMFGKLLISLKYIAKRLVNLCVLYYTARTNYYLADFA